MLLTDPPYGTTRNFWDVPLPLPELWEAVKWAVKPEGAVLFFAQCPYDKVLGASNLAMLRYEWVWYKSRCTGFLNARRAPLKKTENILVFYQKSPAYFPQFEQGKPYKKIHRCSGNSPNSVSYTHLYFSNPRMFPQYGRQKGWERENATTDTGNEDEKIPDGFVRCV